jgi:hypothetical protein
MRRGSRRGIGETRAAGNRGTRAGAPAGNGGTRAGNGGSPASPQQARTDRPGRNDPCPCGSGRKVKRCCGVSAGPSEAQRSQALLTGWAREAVAALVEVSDEEFDDLSERMMDLPERHLSLHLPLPAVLTPDLERAVRAFREDDLDEAAAVLPAVLARLDTPAARVTLARALIALDALGLVEREVAALGLVELASSSNGLVASCLIQALAVAAGVARTPAGLVVARR